MIINLKEGGLYKIQKYKDEYIKLYSPTKYEYDETITEEIAIYHGKDYDAYVMYLDTEIRFGPIDSRILIKVLYQNKIYYAEQWHFAR